MPEYSVIVPVYNRPDEVRELLESLSKQENSDFEILIIEDGSSLPCKEVVDTYQQSLDIKYFFKSNTGPGESRNYGMERAEGKYLIFFDSDCIIPPTYFASLEEQLKLHNFDAFGGSDDAHESFSNFQKAINYTMTSFLTTGGVRGGKTQVNKFQPRSFNMGMKKEVYEKVGGFSDIHPGEDPDLSFRIRSAGYKIGLVTGASVYHKRRIDFGKFATQVYKFGLVRMILNKWYPETRSIVFLLPGLFLLFSMCSVVLSIFGFYLPLFALLFYIFLVFFHSILKTKSMGIGLIVVPAIFIQFWWYGYGYLKSFFYLRVLKRAERKAFPNLFFK